MDKVIVGICTYKRPTMLANCLISLNNQAEIGNCEVIFVIADNDGSDSGEIGNIVKTHLTDKSYIYVTVPDRGISNARNAALDYAVKADAQYIAFIDDDEVADKNWLTNLYQKIKYSGAEAVQGKILFRYPDKIEIPGFVETIPVLDEDTVLKYVGTGNSIIDIKLVKDYALRFNSAYGLSGGEDIDFFMKSQMRGGRHIYTSTAVVEEIIPLEKITLRYQLKRKFMDGLNISNVMRRNKGFPFYFRRYFLKSLWRTIYTPFIILYGFAFNRKIMFKRFKDLYYSLGCICCLFGIYYNGYRKVTGY